METSNPTGRSRPAAQAAFSLVEVVIAIGIVAFAFMAILGMLPVGMSVFRNSMNNAITSQIAQRVINDCQQSDFSELIKDEGGNPITAASGRKVKRYFDDQANETTDVSQAIYWVNTRIRPGTAFSGGAAAFINTNLATVTVQVAHNPPGGTSLESTLNSDNLWSTTLSLIHISEPTRPY